MSNFLLYILIASAWIWGIRCLFSEGFMFGDVGEWADTKIAKWFWKPLILCAPCMSSIHGLLWFFFSIPYCFKINLPIRMLIPFLICLCGFNFIIAKLTSKERVIVDE